MAVAVAPDPLRWYVVRTKPKQEARADSNLRSWNVETLAPFTREPFVRGRSAEATYRIVPLFPCYIFARFAPGAQLSKVRMTRGVHDVVAFAGRAAALDDEVVESVRSRIGQDGYVRLDDPRPGDMVRIEQGALRSLVGVFERELRGQDRVVILLNAMASRARVEVPRTAIRKIAEPSAM